MASLAAIQLYLFSNKAATEKYKQICVTMLQ